MSLETEGKRVRKTDDAMSLLFGYSLKTESVCAECVTAFVSSAVEKKVPLRLTPSISESNCCTYWSQVGSDTGHH